MSYRASFAARAGIALAMSLAQSACLVPNYSVGDLSSSAGKGQSGGSAGTVSALPGGNGGAVANSSNVGTKLGVSGNASSATNASAGAGGAAQGGAGGGATTATGPCVSPNHDGGDGTCVVIGSCSSGYRNGGNGACVATGVCDSGYRDDGTGTCVAGGTCASGYHEGGSGTCVATGTCTSGYHDGGDGVCITPGACATGFRDGGTGSCVVVGTCAIGYHDSGAGECVALGSCATGFHDGGDGSCVILGSCASGYHDSGSGACVTASCSTGYHDGGTGTCVANDACSSSYHNGGTGTCVAAGTCSTGYHDGGSGDCLAGGACSTGYHDGGSGACVKLGACSTGYHDGGAGTCLAAGCSTGYHDGGSGTCIASRTCSNGYHDGGNGSCVVNGTCVTGYHDGGNGSCVSDGSCSGGYHDGGTGSCLPAGTCSPGYHDDGGGTCVANVFIGGPCVTTSNLTSVEIFANGGQRIYRRVVSGTNYGSWASLSGLDAKVIDVRSRLDCTANENMIHIVGTGSTSSPTLGAYMHAMGYGTSYNAFTRELADGQWVPFTTFRPGVSIATCAGNPDGRYVVGATNVLYTYPVWVHMASDNTLLFNMSGSLQYDSASSPDLAFQQTRDNQHFSLVAFTKSGLLNYRDTINAYSPSSSESVVSPPPGTTYNYSPTVCGLSRTASQADPLTYQRHLAVVGVNGKLYHAASATADWSSLNFNAWAAVGTVANAASAPDCVVTSDGTVHIVVLTTTGTVVDVYGKLASWTTKDLGGF